MPAPIIDFDAYANAVRALKKTFHEIPDETDSNPNISATAFGGLGASNAALSAVSEGNLAADGGDIENFIYGTAGNDNLDGSEVNDFIDGDAGNDAINARGGDDFVFGGSGADVVYGGTGNDLLVGGRADVDTTDLADTIYGGGGSDIVLGNAGNDTIYGGRGFVDTEDGADLLHGGLGNDTLYGNAGDDSLVGSLGNDTMHGGLGDDTILIEANGGNDTIGGFEAGKAGGGDVILLAGLGIQNFTALRAMMRDDGTNTTINLGNGNTVVIENHVVSGLDASDFDFA